MKYDRILIDVSNMYYRAFSVSQNLTAEVDGELMSTGGIYTVLKMFKRIRETYLAENGRIFYLFDNATSSDQRRKEIDPEYKANRAKQDPVFYRGLDYLYLVLQVLNDGDRLIRRPGSEADDLVYPVLKSFGDKGYNVLLISNDLDWSRSMSEKVHWMIRDHATKKDVIYTRETYKEKFGFVPSNDTVCLFKAIKGDDSDNIPVGVKNLKTETVLGIIRQAQSVENLYIHLAELDLSDKWKQAFEENKGRVLLNYQLVSFQELTVSETREFTEVTVFNKKVLGMLYRTLKFNAEKLDSRFVPKVEEVKTEDFFGAEKFPRA